jgi:hypothetical protein
VKLLCSPFYEIYDRTAYRELKGGKAVDVPVLVIIVCRKTCNDNEIRNLKLTRVFSLSERTPSSTVRQYGPK